MYWNSSNRFLLAAAFSTVPVSLAFHNSKNNEKNTKFEILNKKIVKARNLIDRTMVTQGIPGLSIGVSIDGKNVWSEGFGFADIETGSKCSSETVMRIASISKPITATIAAKLVEEEKLNLDKNILEYLPEFPQKQFNDTNVTITVRQLLSHSAGIRHYLSVNKKSEILEDPANSNASSDEFMSNKPYKSTIDALNMFKNDQLIAKPGTKFSYTTHGLTLAAAVLEKASGNSFPQLAANLFNELGLRNTQLDVNKKIINYRASFYRRNDRHVLENCPEVDVSYKYAAGGILSNVEDLLVFANAILYSSQSNSKDSIISKSTINQFLQPQIQVDKKSSAALGWFIVPGKDVRSMEGKKSTGGYFYHTGGATGASSVLLIRPSSDSESCNYPSGICVAILCNLQETSVLSLAISIEQIFREF